MTETNSGSESSVNVPTAGQTRLVIGDATGMVGGYALRCAIENPPRGYEAIEPGTGYHGSRKPGLGIQRFEI